MKTFNELKEYIQASRPAKEITSEDVVWFVCMHQARQVSEAMSLKDIASLFAEGITKVTSVEVEGWLSTLSEDTDDDQIEKETIDEHINYMYNSD